MNLSQLAIGKQAMIVALEDILCLNLKSRLKKLGFEKDAAVEVLHQGFPFCDPLAVRIGDYTIAITKKDAANVAVQPL